MRTPEDEIIAATTRLLGTVATGDYTAYSQMVDPSLTCVEPETNGNIIVGLPFHKYFFDLARAHPRRSSIPCARRTCECSGQTTLSSYMSESSSRAIRLALARRRGFGSETP